MIQHLEKGIGVLGLMALVGVWANAPRITALLATGLAVSLVVLWLSRQGLLDLIAWLRGAGPVSMATAAPARTVAHRSEPLDSGLSISIPVPDPPAVEATIALPAVSVPNVAGPVTPEPATLTRQAVGALPDAVPWKLNEAKIDAIPFLSDGVNWLSFNLYGNEDMVICGAKRKGKGNAIQLLTLSALALGPDAAQVWYLDAKQGLDYSFAMDMEHARLYAEIHSADGKLLSDGTLSAGFDAAIIEMERRNQAMYKKARNAREYAARMGVLWPVIVLVVDEAAELDGEQRGKLNKIARMAGAAGFVLMTCTQYPTADVLSSQVQANAVNRVCFQIPSGKYTPVALGLAPGEKSLYEPAAIGTPGVAVYRRGDDQRLGRVPEVTDHARDTVIRQIVNHWPRVKKDELLLNLLGGIALPGGASGGSTNGTGIPVSPDTAAAIPPDTTDPDLLAKVRTLVGLNVSGNAIIQALGGNRNDMGELIKKVREGKL